MAEAFARANVIMTYSAGTTPAEKLDLLVIEVMREESDS